MPEVAAIVAEFQAELDRLAHACADRPEEEVRRLWQVALERESIVVVAYRRDIIGHRLGRMAVPEGVRRVVGRAIRWAWRDEEAHALWIRGVLLREGGRLERLAAWRTMVEGRVAGWTSSRQAHFRWGESPLRRVVAEALEVGAKAAGRVPRVVGEELHFHSFRGWCRFNVGAEATAELAWRRLAVLAADPRARVSPEDAEVFSRIAADEVRHGRLFQVLADAFTDGDTLAPGVDEASLERDLASIGQRFLTAPSAGSAAWQNPLGKGAPVVVRVGPDLREVLAAALEGVGAEALVAGRPRVAIKTTFMMGVDPADASTVVSPDLLRELVSWLSVRGCDVVVLEAPNIYDRFHGGRSVGEVARAFGVDVPVADAHADQVEQDYLRGIGAGTLSAAWRDADRRIVLGKLRSHPVDQALLTLDVIEGLGGRHDAFTFADRKADRHTALLAVADAAPPDLALLDAFADVPDGLTGMFGSRHPIQPRRIYASRDAVSLDVVAAGHVGADPDDMLLDAAFDWFGDPRGRRVVDGPDEPLASWRGVSATRATGLLAALAQPVWDHASGHGALFVPPMDERVFPPLADPGPAMLAARALAQRVVAVGGRRDDEVALLPTRDLHLPGGRVRVHDVGRGPAVVLLHGYPENLQIFARLAQELRAVRVVAFDWPGQGASEAWAGPAGPELAAEQLVAVLDALAIERATLVATDMGCHGALVAAARFPERVERLVVMNALLYGDAPTSWEIAVMRRSGLNRAAFRLAPGVVWRRCLATFLHGASPPEEHLADMFGCFVRSEVREHLVALCDGTEAAFGWLPEAYGRVRCPVLVAWGSHEAHFPPEQGQRLAAELGAAFEVVEGGPHWMVWTHGPALARRIRAFMEAG